GNRRCRRLPRLRQGHLFHRPGAPRRWRNAGLIPMSYVHPQAPAGTAARRLPTPLPETPLNQTRAAILPAEPAPPAFRYAPLLWMALGTFAVGTEGFMIAAILPRIAGDLAVSVQAAGQLVTIFALTYALSSPV